jgi:hypothetical protein
MTLPLGSLYHGTKFKVSPNQPMAEQFGGQKNY